MPEEFTSKFRPLEGQFFERGEFFWQILKALTGKTSSDNLDGDIAEWYEKTWKAGRRDGSVRPNGITSINANGWLGQYLYVYPDDRLVVVRLRHPPADASLNEAGSFGTIEKEIEKLR